MSAPAPGTVILPVNVEVAAEYLWGIVASEPNADERAQDGMDRLLGARNFRHSVRPKTHEHQAYDR